MNLLTCSSFLQDLGLQTDFVLEGTASASVVEKDPSRHLEHPDDPLEGAPSP